MSGTFWVRILGMFLFAILGLWVAFAITGGTFRPEDWRYIASLGVAGAGLGLLITPYLTIIPMRWIRHRLRSVAIEDLFSAGLGLIVGLVLSALLAFPLSMLPDPLGQLLPFITCVVLSYIGASVALTRKIEVFDLVPFPGRRESPAASGKARGPVGILVDSSVIIDGRIADLAGTGFVSTTLIVPQFVLRELQHIADSDDPLRRKRGRRGLDVLNRLQKEAPVPVRISDMDVPEINDVDSKLVQLALLHQYLILTTDYNLNRVAELQGVTVLNIHELAQAVRPAVMPGEEMEIQLVHEGKEYGQGVGYLDDGTMVVVEDAKELVGEKVAVTVSRLLPTTAGRIAFAHLTTTRKGKRGR